jgi:hypothetical protein
MKKTYLPADSKTPERQTGTGHSLGLDESVQFGDIDSSIVFGALGMHLHPQLSFRLLWPMASPAAVP